MLNGERKIIAPVTQFAAPRRTRAVLTTTPRGWISGIFGCAQPHGKLQRVAVAYYDHSQGDEADEEIAAAFAELRPRLQGAVARQAHLKRTPELRFELDKVLRNAERIEQVLRGLGDLGPSSAGDTAPGAGPDA